MRALLLSAKAFSLSAPSVWNSLSQTDDDGDDGTHEINSISTITHVICTQIHTGMVLVMNSNVVFSTE